MKRHMIYCISGLGLAGLIACSPAGGEKRGHEFMPDMVHSTAYEANVEEYYYFNTWGGEQNYMKYAMPRKAVPGTIARGSVAAALSNTPEGHLTAYDEFNGLSSPDAVREPVNGAVPYPYPNTDSGRVQAAQEIINSPFPITEAGLKKGSELFTIYCAICHGTKGDGMGYLVREGDPSKGITAGVYPAAPANFLKESFIDTTAGFFYHTIMYGKNMMGSYADKLSYRERWDVIQYIRSLQAKSKNLVYSEDKNTLNSDIPGGPILKKLKEEEAMKNPGAPGSGEENTQEMQNTKEAH